MYIYICNRNCYQFVCACFPDHATVPMVSFAKENSGGRGVARVHHASTPVNCAKMPKVDAEILFFMPNYTSIVFLD